MKKKKDLFVLQKFFNPRLKILYLLLIPYFMFVLYLQYKRVSAFGCFDDCFNYMGAYFMLKGKVLYSQIFFNHQMLMAYLSYVVQGLLHPATISQLLLYHRMLLFVISVVMDMLLIRRFKLPALGFVIFYEITKFYIFGNRFLAESFIVYFVVYLFGLLWIIFDKKEVLKYEYPLAGFFTWFIVFAREPYVPLALVLYGSFLFFSKKNKYTFISLATFGMLTLVTFATVPVRDYIFNVVTVNAHSVAGNEISQDKLLGVGSLKSFGYPIFLYFCGIWNAFRYYLLGIDSIFLILAALSLSRRRYKHLILVIVALGLANLRITPPGRVYYDAFHLIQWYGIFLFSTFLMLSELKKKFKKIKYVCLFVLSIFFLYLTLGPNAILRDKVDRQTQLMTNYGNYLVNGNVVKILASRGDTLFVDRWEDMIYWQSGLKSPYKYSWYTSVMPGFKVYRDAREEMFHNYPPDFFYGYCVKGEGKIPLPEYRKYDYAQFYFNDLATCLFIKKTKIPGITRDKWDRIQQEYHYHLLTR